MQYKDYYDFILQHNYKKNRKQNQDILLYTIINMKKAIEYYLISNRDFTCYGSSYRLQDAKKRYFEELKEEKKLFWSFKYNDFSIYRISYDPERIEVNYWMDREVYIYDKINDSLLEEPDDLKENGVKFIELKKDFLYYKNK